VTAALLHCNVTTLVCCVPSLIMHPAGAAAAFHVVLAGQQQRTVVGGGGRTWWEGQWCAEAVMGPHWLLWHSAVCETCLVLQTNQWLDRRAAGSGWLGPERAVRQLQRLPVMSGGGMAAVAATQETRGASRGAGARPAPNRSRQGREQGGNGRGKKGIRPNRRPLQEERKKKGGQEAPASGRQL
jgi:hypothetical protein